MISYLAKNAQQLGILFMNIPDTYKRRRVNDE